MHLSVFFIKKRNCKLGSEPRKQLILWQSPKHWITPNQRIKSLRQNSLRTETVCLGFQRFPNFTERWEDNCQEVPIVSRRRTFCERAREESSHLGTYTTRLTKRSKSKCSVRATRKLCIFLLWQTWNVLARKHGTCTGANTVQGTSAQVCEKILPTFEA